MKNNEWNEIRDVLIKNMSEMDYQFLSQDESATMDYFDGRTIVLSTANNLIKEILGCNRIVRTMEEILNRHFGTKISVMVVQSGETYKLLGTDEERTSCNTKMPRMCEVLGVDVSERFRYKIKNECDIYFVDAVGNIRRENELGVADKATILEIINHPEKIIKNKLTEKGQKICELIGAKWVTMDSKTHYGRVDLWKNEPKCDEEGNYKHTTNGVFNEPILACVLREIFMSVEPGDCIYVGE